MVARVEKKQAVVFALTPEKKVSDTSCKGRGLEHGLHRHHNHPLPCRFARMALTRGQYSEPGKSTETRTGITGEYYALVITKGWEQVERVEGKQWLPA